MQRLEVSGAVRPIYGSLGFKRLTEERDVGYKWLFSTFKTDRTSKAKITNDFQGNVIHMATNRLIKTIFKEMFLLRSGMKSDMTILPLDEVQLRLCYH